MENPSTLFVVKNLQESKLFYLNVLGLKFVSESERCIKFLAGTHEVLIFQGTLPAIEYEHGFNSSSTLVFTVDDLDSKIFELKQKDVNFIHDSPNRNDWGRYAAFKDPSGIVHEIFEVFKE
ncbi:MAG: VOC family protein [Shewanella sp.]|nr:VOC family protein [Shewanella sp.]